jgi:hypothetical protein
VPIEFQRRCSGENHTIEVRRDGSVRTLDHDLPTLRAFAAFGAEKPPCLAAVEAWEDDPLGMLITPGKIRPRELGLIAARWGEMAAPIFWEDIVESGVPKETERAVLENALELVRGFWEGDIGAQALQVGTREVGDLVAISSGPQKEVARAVLHAVATTTRLLHTPQDGWIEFPDPAMKAASEAIQTAEHAQEAVGWRTLIGVGTPLFDMPSKRQAFLDRIGAEVTARQVYEAIKILEELRS